MHTDKYSNKQDFKRKNSEEQRAVVVSEEDGSSSSCPVSGRRSASFSDSLDDNSSVYSSSLDVDLLDLNDSSSDDLSTPLDESDDCLSSEEEEEEEGTGRLSLPQLQKPPPLQLPGISLLSEVGVEGSHDKDVTVLKSCRRGGSFSNEGLLPSERGKKKVVQISLDQPLRIDPVVERKVHVDLLTPSFEVNVSMKNQSFDDASLHALQSHCADTFGIRRDRVRVYELKEIDSSSSSENNKSETMTKVGIEIQGSLFTLERLEELLKKSQTSQADEKRLGQLEHRVRELEEKLLVSETMRLKAHKALKSLREEVDLLEVSLLKRKS
jgi:hypothetical protein